jgi:hypothetical protein
MKFLEKYFINLPTKFLENPSIGTEVVQCGSTETEGRIRRS